MRDTTRTTYEGRYKVESLIGQRLGDYILESELGRGSMGVVYRARHVTRGTSYAVKVLLEQLAADMSFVTRFTREARIIAGLHHPNIVRVYEAGRHGQHLYFVMEYFPGVTAGHMLKDRGRLPYAQVIEIAAQAADALDYAHSTGRLVHRDIKPENLLVDRWFRVKMLDFGLARVEGLHSITRVRTVVGSLYYVAPEQLLNQKLDGRTDIYALGVSIYELVTGQRPYGGQTLTEMSRAILSAAAVSPRQLEPSVPLELEHIIAKAMARDLEERYTRAGELYADLRALQATLNLHPQPSGQRSQRLPLSTSRSLRDLALSPAAALDPSGPPLPHLGEHRNPRTLRPTTLEPMPSDSQRDQRPSGPLLPPHQDP
jgi:eukaryotic-like serine/threonine-protein kinase